MTEDDVAFVVVAVALIGAAAIAVNRVAENPRMTQNMMNCLQSCNERKGGDH